MHHGARRPSSAPPLSPTSTQEIAVFAALPLAHPMTMLSPPLPLLTPPPPSLRRSPPQRRYSFAHEPITYRSHSTRDDADFLLGVESEDTCSPTGWPALCSTILLVVFHALNSALGVVALIAILGGLALSLALLPFCGLGVVVFCTLAKTSYYLGRMDAQLHNFIAETTEDKIEFPPDDPERAPLLPVHLPRSPGCEDGRSRFDESALRLLSSRSVLVMVYLGTVKPLVSLLGGTCLAVLALSTLAFFRDNTIVQFGNLPKEPLENEPWLYPVFLAALLLAVVGLHIVARVSQAATRYFCCEHHL